MTPDPISTEKAKITFCDVEPEQQSTHNIPFVIECEGCRQASQFIKQQAQIIADNEKTLEDFKADFTKRYEQQATLLEQAQVARQLDANTIGMQAKEIEGYDSDSDEDQHEIGTLKQKNKELREALEKAKALLAGRKPVPA
jgi:septal ring factor EnvC (AmiA/AmiB activator)